MADEEEKKELAMEKEKLIESEVEAAMEEELGVDWLAEKELPVRIAVQTIRLFAVFMALWFFLCSISLMGSGFSAISGKGAGELFAGQENPLVGLMVGILATVLVQSSSTTTSIIVVLVASDIIEVQTAIPMIMGANIGTSVTNTIVSLGFADDPEAYERGFAGATVHDMFNYLNVLLWLPIELICQLFFGEGPLQAISEFCTRQRDEDKKLEGGAEFKDKNPIKKITNPLVKKLISINKDTITDYAKEFPDPIGDGVNCTSAITFDFKNDVGIAGCTDGTDCVFCEAGEPFDLALYNEAEQARDDLKLIKSGNLEQYGDNKGGILCLVLSFVLLIASLAVIVRVLTAIVQGTAKAILTKSLNYNFVGGGYIAILIGCGLTFVVQSSSITTSILTPLVAVDALSVENMFPYTLGANIGTTGTGLIAAATKGETNGYNIALVHFFFNVFGTLFWFPIPKLRNVPISMAKFLGSMAAIWRVVPVIYILMAFIFYPVFFFLISLGYQSDSAGLKFLVSIILAAALAAHVFAIWWYKKRDGKNKFIAFVEKRKAKLAAKKAAKAGNAEPEL